VIAIVRMLVRLRVIVGVVVVVRRERAVIAVIVSVPGGGVTGIAVVVVMRRPAVRVRVGARLGLERRLDADDARTETRDHRLEDVVAPDADPVVQDLGRDVPVAEMPGDAAQEVHVPEDLRHGLRARDDAHDAAFLEREPVAFPQGDRLGEVEQEGQAAGAAHRHAPAMAPVVGQLDAVDLVLRTEAPVRSYCGRSLHGPPQKRK
jgi:hypothetical protein